MVLELRGALRRMKRLRSRKFYLLLNRYQLLFIMRRVGVNLKTSQLTCEIWHLRGYFFQASSASFRFLTLPLPFALVRLRKWDCPDFLRLAGNPFLATLPVTLDCGVLEIHKRTEMLVNESETGPSMQVICTNRSGYKQDPDSDVPASNFHMALG